MQSRWSTLAVLFTARVTMAFQFQAVAALGPLFTDSYGRSLADLGLLIGLYLAPGLAVALPGGGLAQRFGTARLVGFGLVLMCLGGALMWLAPGWNVQLAGRVLAGCGGVLLNVLMSKMVTDAFAGREIGTAMGIFVNSWPVGIALALLVLPPIATGAGLGTALAVAFALTAAGLILFVLTIPMPAGVPTVTGGKAAWPTGWALSGIIMAGAIWGLYNAALSMVFSFGPTLMVERNWTLPAASSAISLVLWMVAISVPLGGWLADKTRAHDRVLVAGLILFMAMLGVLIAGGPPWVTLPILGLCAGLPAGPIMALPARLLLPKNSALGLGLFFTLFYLMIMVAPMIAGGLSSRFGSSTAAMVLGIVMLGLCLPLLGLVRRAAAQLAAPRHR